MGLKSCDAFFQNLKALQTKSLLLTSQVIRERQKLKNAILNFPEEIDVYFSKLIHEEQKVNILKKYPDKHDKFEYEDEKSKKTMSEENLLKDIHFEIQKLEIGMQLR